MEAAFVRCDALHNSGHVIEALGTILKYKDDPSPEVQWRVGRGIFKESEYKGTGPKHKAIAEAAVILKKVLETSPDCAQAHLWYAIVLGQKEKHDSVKQQIEEAFIVRKHADKCLELDPKCELAHHVLGVWCYQVASVPWVQRKAAALFAKPPEATLEEAIAALKKAEELCPDNILNNNHIYMAKAFIDMGKKDEAAEYIKKCVVLTEEKKNDRESLDNVEEAKKLAKEIDLKL